ncbi:MAG: Cellulophaga phage phi18:3 [Bacteroidota bacterium]|jgi:hypothetical protein
MSYYKEQIPEIIERLKIAIEQCKEVISQTIDVELADDKLHAVLKGKRMATEDAMFYAKQIDVLEAELSGKNTEETETNNPVKRFRLE